MYYTIFQNLPTEIDYKSHVLNFRQEGRGTVVVQAVEGNGGVDDDMNNLWYVFAIYFFMFCWIINK